MNNTQQIHRAHLLGMVEINQPSAVRLLDHLIPSGTTLSVPDLNRCLRYELIKLPVNTLGAREWLDDTMDGQTWVTMFIRRILPVFVKGCQHHPRMAQPLFSPSGVMV